MLKTKAEIARLKSVSRQAVDDFIRKNAVPAAGKKGKLPTYDTEAEPLASYLSARKPSSAAADPKPPEAPEPADPPLSSAAPGKISKPLNDILGGVMKPGQKPATYFLLKAWELAKENKDAALTLKLAQIAAQEDRYEEAQLQALETEKAKEKIAQERAAALKLDNDVRRGAYIPKETVRLIFGRTYGVMTSQIQPLGLKLADTIAAIPDGPDRRNTIQKLIDDDVYAACESIQRLLKDFFVSAA